MEQGEESMIKGCIYWTVMDMPVIRIAKGKLLVEKYDTQPTFGGWFYPEGGGPRTWLWFHGKDEGKKVFSSREDAVKRADTLADAYDWETLRMMWDRPAMERGWRA